MQSMKPETKLKCSTAAAVIYLAASGTAILWKGDDFLEVLAKAAKTDLVLSSSFVGTLGAALLAASFLVIPRRSRTVGWMIASGAVTILLLAGLLISTVFSSLYYRNSSFSTGWISFGVIMSAVVTCLLATLGDWSHSSLLETEKQSAEQLKTENERLEGLATVAREERTRVVDGLKEKLKEANAATGVANQQLKTEREQHLQTKLGRPYESQLVATFSLSLGIAWQRQCPGVPFLLNHYQGNRDREFGDFIGQVQGYCWLIELKRDWNCVDTEFQKPIRKRQCDAVRADRKLSDTAAQCHWLGWGVTDQHEVMIHLCDYWACWPGGISTPTVIDYHSFASRAFGGADARPVGVVPDKFAQYLRFLADMAGGNHRAEDTIAALVFHFDGHDRVRCWVEQDLVAVGQVIAARYEEKERIIEKQREAARLAQELADQSSPRPRRSGPSLG
jgi:hypothetical protein